MQKETDHRECEERFAELTAQSSKDQLEIERLQHLSRNHANEILDLQQQLIDCNTHVIKQQQQITDHNLLTNNKLTAINNQIFDFLDCNTGKWAEPATNGSHNKGPPEETNSKIKHGTEVNTQNTQNPPTDKAQKHLNRDKSKIAEQTTKDTKEFTTPS